MIWHTAGSGTLTCFFSTIGFTSLLFAAYSLVGQPCIIIWDKQACLWKPTCMWEPPEENLLAPATVNPMLVVLHLWQPAIVLLIAGALVKLGCVVVPPLAKGFWAVLRRLFRAYDFLRFLLADRPRLHHTVRQMTMVGVVIFAWSSLFADSWSLVSLAPYTHALFVSVVLSVVLDIKWWFVDRPSWGLHLAFLLFPDYVLPGVPFVIFWSLFLLDVFVRTKEDPRIRDALHQEPFGTLELSQLCARRPHIDPRTNTPASVMCLPAAGCC